MPLKEKKKTQFRQRNWILPTKVQTNEIKSMKEVNENKDVSVKRSSELAKLAGIVLEIGKTQITRTHSEV